MKKSTIAIIDDDLSICNTLKELMEVYGHRVEVFNSAVDFLASFEHPESESAKAFITPDVILSDISMPDMSGFEFIVKFQKYFKDIPVILITAQSSVGTAVHAMRVGAFDFVVKPFRIEEIESSVDRALKSRSAGVFTSEPGKEIARESHGMIGNSRKLADVFETIQKVSRTIANVLITGESGTGKELVARAIHRASLRAKAPFIAINCSAIPADLLESELFGHGKGAFTGAVTRKKGLFQEADGGTLFLDEIGDMAPSLQAKMLRVLQEKKVRPVGENELQKIDVRVIAATHKNLHEAIKNHEFREDLFYRLSVIPIELPALRNRRDDIRILADHFLHKFVELHKATIKGFTAEALQALEAHAWPGNIRELENTIERAVILSNSDRVEADTLLPPAPSSTDPETEVVFKSEFTGHPTLEELEKRYIQFVLESTAGVKDKASQILGIDRKTLYRKEKAYALSEEQAAPGPEPTL